MTNCSIFLKYKKQKKLHVLRKCERTKTRKVQFKDEIDLLDDDKYAEDIENFIKNLEKATEKEDFEDTYDETHTHNKDKETFDLIDKSYQAIYNTDVRNPSTDNDINGRLNYDNGKSIFDPHNPLLDESKFDLKFD